MLLQWVSSEERWTKRRLWKISLTFESDFVFTVQKIHTCLKKQNKTKQSKLNQKKKNHLVLL